MAITNGYATLNQLKGMLRIPAVDTVDDSQLERVIESASRRIDGKCDRRFYLDAAATARVYLPRDWYHVSIDDVGNLTGFEVRIDDGSGTYPTLLVQNVDYRLEPLNNLAKGEPVYRLISTSAVFPVSTVTPSVQVTARWGWPTIPDAIEEATVLLAGRMFKRADSLLGVAGFGDLGAISVRGVDPDVDHLIQPYRRMAVG
jgi:hypothetical protein